MKHQYRHLDPDLIRRLLAEQSLQELFNRLLLSTGGNVEQAMRWMRQLQERGLIDGSVDLDAFFESLEERQLLERGNRGQIQLSMVGERRLRQSAFQEIFSQLEKGAQGYHPVRAPGAGAERLPETRPYRFGDDYQLIDPIRTTQNALKRTYGRLDNLREQDFEVYETEHRTSCATVVAIDISHSMILYGEDRITPARTVALALTELIETRFPKDHLEIILFGDEAQRVDRSEIPYIEAGPFHTNTRDALRLSRSLLSRRKQPNKQIVLITDGKPSAITERGQVYKNPFGLDLKIVNLTLEEAKMCRRKSIVITTFMLATDPPLRDFVEKLTKVNRGRAFYASPRNLGEFVLADYVRNRRKRFR